MLRSSLQRRASLVGVLTGLGALLFTCGPGCGSTPRRSEPQVDGRTGADLYRTYCALCHGENGEGYAADNANALNNQRFLESVTDDFLREGIIAGHPGTPMAAYGRDRGGPLSDEEVEVLVAFIRDWQDGPSVDVHDDEVIGSTTRGQTVYDASCAGCHGDTGQGQSAMSLNNPVFLATASDGQIRYAIRHGRPDTTMPAFEDTLSAQEIDDVTALIRSWASEVEAPETPTFEDHPVVTNPDGDAPEFSELREGRFVPAEEVAAALQDGRRMILLDARPPSDYVRYHIPGAIPSPYYEIENVKARLPRDGTWIVAYCGCPHAASGRVMDHLREEGFENTAVLDEGVLVWSQEGYPVVRGEAPGSWDDGE